MGSTEIAPLDDPETDGPAGRDADIDDAEFSTPSPPTERAVTRSDSERPSFVSIGGGLVALGLLLAAHKPSRRPVRPSRG